jgi:hypothetical protein
MHGRTGSCAGSCTCSHTCPYWPVHHRFHGRRCNTGDAESEGEQRCPPIDVTAVARPPGIAEASRLHLCCWTSHSPQSKVIKYVNSSIPENALVSTETASAAVRLTILQASSWIVRRFTSIYVHIAHLDNTQKLLCKLSQIQSMSWSCIWEIGRSNCRRKTI